MMNSDAFLYPAYMSKADIQLNDARHRGYIRELERAQRASERKRMRTAWKRKALRA